jgi:hypothetical protein
MVGTEHGHRHEPRRFITRHDVEDAAAAGRSIRLRGRDILTDEAAQRAMDLGVDVEREGSTIPGVSTAPTKGSPAAPSSRPSGPTARTEPAASDADLRRAVRAAVIAEIGAEPPGLDAAIDRVLQRRSR